MAKPFDATLKELVAAYPRDWLVNVAGVRDPREIEVLSVDLSTVTAATDFAIRADGCIYLFDFQSGADRDARIGCCCIRALARFRYRIPVESTLVMLRPAANASAMTGQVAYRTPNGSMDFRYHRVRIWQLPAEELLEGGPGTVPLAILGALPRGRKPNDVMPDIVEQAVERIEASVEPGEARDLLAATFVLGGLKYAKGDVARWFRGVTKMRESETYQMILEEGEAKGEARGITLGELKHAREMLFTLATLRFGEPTAATRKKIDQISDRARLDRMTVGIADVAGWPELLKIR